MKEVRKVVGFTEIDMINTSVSESLKEAQTDVLQICGVAIGKDVDVEKGEIIDVAYIKNVDGVIYGTVSPTVTQSLEIIADMLEAGKAELYNAIIVRRTAKSGREFLSIRVTE